MDYFPPDQQNPGDTIPTVAIEEFASTAALLAAIQRLRARISAVSSKIGNVVAPTVFKGPDGKDIDYTGVYANLLHYDILITNPVNDARFSEKYGGTMNQTPEGFVSLLKPFTVIGYDAHGEAGLNYLFLHEIAHSLREVSDKYATLYRQYTDGGGLPADFENSSQFAANERYANYVAREIARTIGEPIMDNPPYGYGD